MRRVISMLCAVAAVVMMTLVVAVGPSGATTAVKSGGNLTFAISSYPNDMNPYSATVDNVSLAVWNAFWEYLVQPSADGSKIVPMLATSWTVSSDGLTYDFQLRPGVKFSNGTPLTSADVVYSLQQAFGQSGSQINFLNSDVAGITAPSASSVQVQLKTPWPYLLQDLSGFNAAILPAGLIQQEGMTAFLANPIGTGPFAISSVSAGSSITMKKNPYYWQPGKPYLNSITFKVIDSDSARATAVQGGQADIAMTPPANEASSLASNSNLKLYKVHGAEVETLLLNVQNPALSNQDVRQAISYATDRAGIVKTGLFGYGTPASTFLVGPAAQTHQNTSLNLYSFNLSKAEALIKASKVKTPIKLSLIVTPGSAQDAIGTVLQQDLSKIGVKLKVVQEDYNTANSAINAENFVMGTNNWDDYVGDASEQPQFWINPGYCCQAYFTNYNNPAATALVEKAIVATNPTQVTSLFNQVQKSVATSDHAIPLYYPTFLYVSSSKVAGFNVTPFGVWSFPDMGFKS